MRTGKNSDISHSNGETNSKNKRAAAKIVKFFINKLRTFLNLKTPTLKESLEEVIEEHDAEVEEIPYEEKTLLRNVLTFSELSVEDIMVPRADVVFVDNNITLDDLKKTIIEKAQTRMPVCKGSLDEVIGFVHTKDLVSALSADKEFDLDSITRETLFVPPSMKISDLLLKMRVARVHMALVVDEYGGTSGLVTLEDVMEEIVGEIEDEHDIENEENMMIELSADVYDINARVEIEELEEFLSAKFHEDKDDFDTLGGMIFAKLGRIPAKGEVIIDEERGFEFEIAEADPRKIKRVIIRRKYPKLAQENSAS